MAMAMALTFPIHGPARYAAASQPVKRPKEFVSFSYDENRNWSLGDKSLKWYYPPNLGADLNKGYDQFISHDDSVDEHLDGLLRAVAKHEEQTNTPIDAHILTWRGMMTKIMAAPYDDEPFEMNATLYRGCIFIEENHEFSQRKKAAENRQVVGNGRYQMSVYQYWGYKFEALCTMPRPWGETSREYIESREDKIVNNAEQYCSVVRTGFGNTIVCLGGEVDAIWDAKPEIPGAPINWVELKTSAEITHKGQQARFDRKLLKYWIQSFLLGVPKIIVGFRSQDGILKSIKEFDTIKIPQYVQTSSSVKWDGNVCINFTTQFLEWLRSTIKDEGVWRIRRAPGSRNIELFKVEEVGHGDVVADSFMNWRIQLECIQERQKHNEAQSQPEAEPGSSQTQNSDQSSGGVPI